MKTWDVVIAGGGIIGVSLARELRKHGAEVLIVERGEPGHEASSAAAGMLADADPHLAEALKPLAAAGARMYPEFVHEIEDESGERVDLRREGTLLLADEPPGAAWSEVAPAKLREMEPRLAEESRRAFHAPEMSVDPRALMAASLKAAKHRGIEVASGSTVTGVEVTSGRAAAVTTDRTKFAGAAIVNCCGAWAGGLAPVKLPLKPIKGHMLSVIAPGILCHVVRAPGVYLVPRSDGRLLIGSTLEDVGFDKRVEPETIQQLHQAAANVVPEIGQARMHEAWAGLQPGTPDELPILGRTPTEGYFVAAGHYTNGILLAPLTARLMTQVIRGQEPEFELAFFRAGRFSS